MAGPQTFAPESVSFKPDIYGMNDTGYGDSLAVDGEWVAVGVNSSPHAPWLPAFYPRGSVEMWRIEGGVRILKQTIESPDLWVGGQFGQRVVVSGSTMVVAETRYGYVQAGSPIPGRCHVYELTSGVWQHIQTLRATAPWGPGTSSFFGDRLALDGDWAVIAAGEWEFGLGLDAPNALYSFQRQPDGSWLFKQRIPAPLHSEVPDPEYYHFGSSLSLDGGLLIVAAPSTRGGAVFAYRLIGDQWMLEHQFIDPLNPWNGADWTYGKDVSVDQNRVAISAVTETNTGVTNFIDFFEWDGVGTWLNRGRLYPPGPGQTTADSPRFGASLELEGNMLFVGAPGGSEPEANNRGRCHLFERDDNWIWTEIAQYRNSDRELGQGFPGEELGREVAADFEHGILLASAPQHRAWGPNGASGNEAIFGAAYLFDHARGEAVCPGSMNSAGTESGLSLLGSPRVVDDILTMHGFKLPVGEFALCLYGQVSAPFPIQTGGNLCVLGGAVTRLFPAIAVGETGEIFHEIDFAAPLNALHLQAGTTWGFQIWHRDLQGGQSVTGTSRAIELMLE